MKSGCGRSAIMLTATDEQRRHAFTAAALRLERDAGSTTMLRNRHSMRSPAQMRPTAKSLSSAGKKFNSIATKFDCRIAAEIPNAVEAYESDASSFVRDIMTLVQGFLVEGAASSSNTLLRATGFGSMVTAGSPRLPDSVGPVASTGLPRVALVWATRGGDEDRRVVVMVG